MLHILTSSPWKCDINGLFRILQTGDDLLLVQDGVFASVNGSRFVKIFTNTPASVFALMNDIKARGLIGKITDKISIIDYMDFVDLVVRQPAQMNW